MKIIRATKIYCTEKKTGKIAWLGGISRLENFHVRTHCFFFLEFDHTLFKTRSGTAMNRNNVKQGEEPCNVSIGTTLYST
jgi:hypothetical protein